MLPDLILDNYTNLGCHSRAKPGKAKTILNKTVVSLNSGSLYQKPTGLLLLGHQLLQRAASHALCEGRKELPTTVFSKFQGVTPPNPKASSFYFCFFECRNSWCLPLWGKMLVSGRSPVGGMFVTYVNSGYFFPVS